jgi:hypothetical protein
MLLYGKIYTPREETQAYDVMVKKAIVEEVRTLGHSGDDYISPWNVERYLGDQWKLVIDSNSVKIQQRMDRPNQGLSSSASEQIDSSYMLAPTFIPGFPSTGQRLLSVGPLLQKLTAMSVTIGEGPRWLIADVDAAVDEFLQSSRP